MAAWGLVRVGVSSSKGRLGGRDGGRLGGWGWGRLCGRGWGRGCSRGWGRVCGRVCGWGSGRVCGWVCGRGCGRGSSGKVCGRFHGRGRGRGGVCLPLVLASLPPLGLLHGWRHGLALFLVLRPAILPLATLGKACRANIQVVLALREGGGGGRVWGQGLGQGLASMSLLTLGRRGWWCGWARMPTVSACHPQTPKVHVCMF